MLRPLKIWCGLMTYHDFRRTAQRKRLGARTQRIAQICAVARNDIVIKFHKELQCRECVWSYWRRQPLLMKLFKKLAPKTVTGILH